MKNVQGTDFIFDPDGHPILPPISDTITLDSLRKLLKDYIRLQWSMFSFR